MFTKIGMRESQALVDRKGLHQSSSFTDHKVDLVLEDTIKYHKVEKSDPELAHFPQYYETPVLADAISENLDILRSISHPATRIIL